MRPLVCSIGSTDPTAAAGIGRDLAVYAQLGVDGALAVAAVTAQNRKRVTAVEPLPARVLTAQLAALWAERRPAAIRVGLLPTAGVIKATAAFLRRLRRMPPVVIDPVLAASSGRRFLDAAAIDALFGLLPLATMITPNIAEAQALSGVRIRSVHDAREAALRLRERLASHSHSPTQRTSWVLVTGGHLRGDEVVDVLAGPHGVVHFRGRRIAVRMRGTGCALAAAIAAHLAKGAKPPYAVGRARKFVRRALEAHRR